MSGSSSLMTIEGHAPESSAAATLPRLLAGIPTHGAMSLDAHVAVHGPLPLAGRRERRAESPLTARIERAGLLGRGGAAFPTATKRGACRPARPCRSSW